MARKQATLPSPNRLPVPMDEMRSRAFAFVEEYKNETYEKGEAQEFWRDLLAIFEIDRRRAGAFFEYATRKLEGGRGFIDLFWPGKLVAEHKSAGRDLTHALGQALDYLPAMPDYELPKAVVASDFQNFQILYLDGGTGESLVEFPMADLPRRLNNFSFLWTTDEIELVEQTPVNIKAAEDMAKLHNELAATGFRGHDLELLLTRIVFCLFAEDTGIFTKGQFERFVRSTKEDGSDLGPMLQKLFEVLDTADNKRSTALDSRLSAFRYINGGIFADTIRSADFRSATRHALLTATHQDWSKVSPAIFGSMFQGVMDEKQRRNLGAHYTSERNILKLIQPLFLDDLYAEFERVKSDPNGLDRFHDKLARLQFLDPACGCGNFLVIAYRELRRLEHKLIAARYPAQSIPIESLIRVNVDQFFGIEIEEFPARVAQLALWVTDHQMNIEASSTFGDYYIRMPLQTAPNIVNANALTSDWAEVVDPDGLNYIMGNPPFIGSKLMTPAMRQDLNDQFAEQVGIGVLDYVTAWFAKAARFMEEHKHVRTALVATNSISQGEQVAPLWSYLLASGVTIEFAHQTFAWSNDAQGQAAVFCVIVGFCVQKPRSRRLFEYLSTRGQPVERSVKRINSYLTDGPTVLVYPRQQPISKVPRIGIGNKPIDGGFYLFTDAEKEAFIQQEPGSAALFRRWYGAEEFLQRRTRWCLFVRDVSPTELRKMPLVMSRIEAVRNRRLESKSAPTRRLAETPTEFHVTNVPAAEYLLIPKVSSENREYIPIGFMSPTDLASDLVFIVPGSTRYHFGVLTSRMHMAWVRAVCGRLKGDYRYSKDIVYNNFPWPGGVSQREELQIENLAQETLDARNLFPNSSLADLYHPLVMPTELRRAHNALDRAVDRLYRKSGFETDEERLEVLFDRYKQLLGE